MPYITAERTETIYRGMAALVTDQLKCKIIPRRIYRLSFIEDAGKHKRRFVATVGELDPRQGKYMVMAIYEANTYIIYARSTDGSHGLTILVAKESVTSVKDFVPRPS